MKKNCTLIELLIGISFVGIIAQVVCLIFLKQHLYHAVGLWVGILISAGMAIHMQYSIEAGLNMSEEAGAKHMQKASFLRTIVICAVIAVVLYKKWGNPLTILVGIMALKVAAYSQPFLHKILEKRRKGE